MAEDAFLFAGIELQNGRRYFRHPGFSRSKHLVHSLHRSVVLRYSSNLSNPGVTNTICNGSTALQ